MALNKESMLSAEYNTLRSEVLQRISSRYTVINFLFVLFAAALGFKASSLVLLYPVMACFLLGKFVSNEHSKDQIIYYITTYIEEPIQTQNSDYVGWQHFKNKQKQDSFAHRWARWLFFVSEVVTLIVAWGIQQPDFTRLLTVSNVQYLIAVVFTFITLGLVLSPHRPVYTPSVEPMKPAQQEIRNPQPLAS